MESQIITQSSTAQDYQARFLNVKPAAANEFQALLGAVAVEPQKQNSLSRNKTITSVAPNLPLETVSATPSQLKAAEAYQENMVIDEQMTGWEKYKDDQLLSNPGGDYYFPGLQKKLENPEDQTTVWGAIKKDLSDAFSNLKNCFENLAFGAKTLYRDENNEIREGRQKGLIGSVVDFSKDLISALSFGMWRPDGEDQPKGIVDRLGFFFKKTKEAVLGDLVQGVSSAALNVGEDLILAGWNLTEVIPDATIGHVESGRKLTTTIFDNGQVIIDYLTDIVPTGEAWLRVHASRLKGLNNIKAPVVYNLNMPEQYNDDVRWKHVRNTSFRKSIETVGALLADAVTVGLFGNTQVSSEETRDSS